jgi:hypothetical protein
MAKPKPADQVSTKTLRGDLRAIRDRVQFEGESIPVYNYGDLVGGLVPVAIADQLNLRRTQTCKSAEFRQEVTRYCKRLRSGLDDGLDGVWVTVHDERAIALVSGRIWSTLQAAPQPILECQIS